MKKVILAAALAVTMGNASAGFFGNNYYGNDRGIFGFNPYSFMEPRWFIKEASNFVDEFDNNNYRYTHIPTGYNHYSANTKQYTKDYWVGYSRYYR
jgi:hypothetical protein